MMSADDILLILRLAWPIESSGSSGSCRVSPHPAANSCHHHAVSPLRYTCRRGTPSLTGLINDPAWDKVPWTSDFVDIEGDKQPLPRFKTRAKMLWDSEFLYVASWMEEPQAWATLTEHDSVIFHDNDFEVFIDPDGDAQRYFEFEVNALGTTWDLYLALPYRDGGSADNSWESDALVRVHVDGALNDASAGSKSWSVELAFPWQPFRANGGVPCPPIAGDTWRINFSRVQWLVDVVEGRYRKRPDQTEANWVWSPQGVIDMHQPEQWGYLDFAN